MWPFNRKKQTKRVSHGGRRAFAGAQMGRLVGDWVAMSTSIDAEIKGSLKALRNRTRQLERDNDYMKSFLREVEINVIGQGIPFQSQVRMQRGGKLDERTNDLIESKWKAWTQADRCHVAGKLSFHEITRLFMRSVARDGEFVVRLIHQPFGKSRVPLGLELIESDRLDDEYNGRTPDGREIRMGVELDQWCRPTAYYFRAQHPGDYPFAGQIARVGDQRIRVPAREVFHRFITERAGQTRGFPWVASALKRLHQMQGYEEAEVIAARAGASNMGFIQNEEGEVQADSVDGEDRVTDFEPGTFKYLNKGETVNIPNQQRPGSQFDPFNKAMLRATAAGIGASYETLSKDYSSSNYSSSRLSLLSDRDNWRVLQTWIMEKFHQPVFEAWLDASVLSGDISLPGYWTNPERYQAVKWMPRGWAWVDPLKETNAYKSAVRSGFMTVSDVVTQAGGDFEELMTQRKREVDLMKESDLVFDTDPQQVSNAGLTQARPGGSVLPGDTSVEENEDFEE